MNDLSILDFDHIKEMLLEFAATDYAKEKINNLSPYLSQALLLQAQNETQGAREILDFAGNINLPDLIPVTNLLSAIEKEGLVTPIQLENFAQFLSAVKRLKNYLKKAEQTGKNLAFYGENLEYLEEVFIEIERCIRGNDVDSNATKQLSDIRRQIDVCNAQLKAKMDEVLRANKQYCSDSFVSIKDGRYTIPLKKEYRHKVPGSVIALSSTGTTCFVEPLAGAKMLSKLEMLHTEEMIEKEKILYMIGSMIWEKVSSVRKDIQTIETLDFAFAKGKLSVSMKAVAPMFCDEAKIEIVKGRHPLLNPSECVPLDFAMEKGLRGIVITGPNTGGKTVALKLIGLFSVMAQSGLHVSAQSVTLCMRSNVLCDIGDGQSISQNLSTFSAHITNVIDILNQTGKDSLVLLDELGSGTDPAEGMGIAISVLEELRKRECLFVATTHYAEVKKYAQNAEGITNARMTFDKDTLKPLYSMVIGQAGESCAFYIAKKLGFPDHMLKVAFEHTYCVNEEALNEQEARKKELQESLLMKESGKEERKEKIPKANAPKLEKVHPIVKPEIRDKFTRGDSVMVYPDHKIGIVFQPMDEQGIVIVQIQNRKRKVNHKRLKLITKASQMYPDDYDFSIVFDTVANRKARHDMDRKYSPDAQIVYEKIEDGKK